MTTTHAILRRPIPQGGFGRSLTETECRALRAKGVSCSRRWIVVRRVFDINSLGILYYPAPGGGYNNAGVWVST